MKILNISSALLLLITLTSFVLFNGSTAKVKYNPSSSGKNNTSSIIEYMDKKYTSPELERTSVFIQIVEKINYAVSNPESVIKEAEINFYTGK